MMDKPIINSQSDSHNKPNMNEPRFRITPLQNIASAFSGALITSFFVTPLEVIKVRMQAQSRMKAENKCFFYSNGLMDHICPCNGFQKNASNVSQCRNVQWFNRPSQFNGTRDALKKIAKNEGILSLWSGLSPTLILALPATILYFVSYEQIRRIIQDIRNPYYGTNYNQLQPSWISGLSGCLARFGVVTCVSPLELTRTKMQSKKLSYFEIHQALKSLLQYHGYKGLWKGFGSTLLRDVPFSGIYWITYERIKQIPAEPTFTYNFIAGFISGSLAAALTTPFDVVKTFQQIELTEKEIIAEPPERASKWTVYALIDIYKKDGVSAVFSGIVPRVVKIALACAIMISTLEYGKTYFQKKNMQSYYEKKN